MPMPPRPSSLSMIQGPSRVPIMGVVPADGCGTDDRIFLQHSRRGQGFPPTIRRKTEGGRRKTEEKTGRARSSAFRSPVARRPREIVKTAFLVIAHGSRQAEANADLYHVVDGLRQRGHAVVEAAFLELAEPDIAEAGRRCVAQGAAVVVLVPYFLSAGVHVRRDLTEARAQLASRFPAVDFRLAEPLGRHPLLLEVVAERAREALDGPRSPS